MYDCKSAGTYRLRHLRKLPRLGRERSNRSLILIAKDELTAADLKYDLSCKLNVTRWSSYSLSRTMETTIRLATRPLSSIVGYVMQTTQNLLARNEAEQILGLLTEAQAEVYDRVLLHMTSKEIARDLDIAPNTVDQRVKAAWPKLGAYDRASAARRYALLKSICGQTTYGEPAIDFRPESSELLEQDLPDSPIFFVEDASSFESHFVEAQPTVLEALDERIGPLGRIVAILLAALMLATVALIVTAVAVTLGNLI